MVSQGITTREKVDECVSILRRLAEAGVTPRPTLGELLVKKGYLSPSQFEGTLRLSQATPPTRLGSRQPPQEPALPAEAAEAAKDAVNILAKYIRVSRLGAGGMGEVWKAWDRELGRWVALKFLKSDSPEELARFRREAQTAAKLSHPNICAVYEVGEHHGKPFIAMQYVEGQTLQTFPRDDRKLLVQLVRNAALAVHYAHEEGVVHRDLKPANLMVEGKASPKPKTTRRSPEERKSAGPRVLVMDFGLAKQTAVDSSLSMSGAILGTPAYMPPEQARGNLSQVGPRSDIYSLGATLYELLADRPPFRDPNVYDLLKNVVEEEPKPVRKANPKVDGDLETIVAKSMEKDAARRYGSALELAEDLSRYLEGEAILAHPPSVAYRLHRWAARRKAVVAVGVAGVALAAIVAALVIPRWIAAVRARELEARGREKEVREKAEKQRQLDREKADRLTEYERRERARPYIESGRRLLENIQVRLKTLSFDLSKAGASFEAAKVEFQKALDVYPSYPEAHLGIASVFWQMGNKESALQELNRAISASPSFSTAYLDRVRYQINDYEQMKHDLSGETRKDTPASLLLRAGLESDLAKVEDFSKDLAERLYAKALLSFSDGNYLSATELLREYLKTAIADYEAHLALAHSLHHLERHQEALAAASSAVEFKPHDPRAYLQLSMARAALGDVDGAIGDCDKVIEMVPLYAGGYRSRGDIRWRKREKEMALADYAKAITLDPRNAVSYFNRGVVRQEMGDLDGAIQDYNRAIELRPEDDRAFNNRGTAREAQGDLEGALADYNRALATNPEHGPAYTNRGVIEHKRGDLVSALRDYDTAIRIDSKDVAAHINRADVRWRMGDKEGSIRDLDRAIEIEPVNSQAHLERGILRGSMGDIRGAEADLTRAVQLEPSHPKAYIRRGDLRRKAGDWEGASEDYTKAIAIHPHAETHNNRGFVRERVGNLEAAIADYTRAIQIDPQHAMAYYNRGNARRQSRDLDGAISDYTKAIELDPKLVIAYANRGATKRLKNDWAGAFEDLDKAIEIDPGFKDGYTIRAGARSKNGDHKGAIEDYTHAIRIDARHANAYSDRGIARESLGDVVGAITDYSSAIEIEPRHANALFNRGLARSVLNDWKGSVSDFTKAIEVRPSHVEAYVHRARAREALGESGGAIEDYVKALELDPRNASTLNASAWALLTVAKSDLRDPKSAQRYAQKAAELTGYKDPAILDTLALAYSQNGSLKEAVETQRRAISLLPATMPPKDRKEYEDRLKEYESAVRQKKE